MSLPEATVTVRRMGREGEPLVIVDGFSGKVDELREAGYAATYRGRQLHSGVIPEPAVLSPDPRKGRLTINMFIRGM
ncbi:MAG: DUF6445 family protein [Erythrobacter sp.]